MITFDTNIFLRSIDKNSNHFEETKSFFHKLMAENTPVRISSQIIYESWVVLTRPQTKNGFGIQTKDAYEIILELMESFNLLPDLSNLTETWLDLVTAHEIRGILAHDTRLVAWMKNHEIQTLVTFNKQDFIKFPIIVLTPNEYLVKNYQQ